MSEHVSRCAVPGLPAVWSATCETCGASISFWPPHWLKSRLGGTRPASCTTRPLLPWKHWPSWRPGLRCLLFDVFIQLISVAMEIVFSFISKVLTRYLQRCLRNNWFFFFRFTLSPFRGADRRRAPAAWPTRHSPLQPMTAQALSQEGRAFWSWSNQICRRWAGFGWRRCRTTPCWPSHRSTHHSYLQQVGDEEGGDEEGGGVLSFVQIL